MYTKVNVGRPTGANPGARASRSEKITVIDTEDIQSFPADDGKGVRIPGNIVMKPGKYAVQLYGTLNTIADGFKIEGDPDKRGFQPSVSFEHPGEELEILEFIQNYLGKNCIVILDKCDGGAKRIFGRPCEPLQLGGEGINSTEESTNKLMFEGVIPKGKYIPGIYEGTVTLATATGTFAAGDATPSVANGEGRYELTNNVSANEITGLDDASNGKLYTLVGMGGSNPSTVTDDNNFVLASGTTWTATSGATLTVRAMAVAAGFKFIEVSRS